MTEYHLARIMGLIDRYIPLDTPVPWRRILHLTTPRDKAVLGRGDVLREAVLTAAVERGVLIPVGTRYMRVL